MMHFSVLKDQTSIVGMLGQGRELFLYEGLTDIFQNYHGPKKLTRNITLRHFVNVHPTERNW